MLWSINRVRSSYDTFLVFAKVRAGGKEPSGYSHLRSKQIVLKFQNHDQVRSGCSYTLLDFKQ